MGLEAYTHLLGLGPVQLYDAQGNHFDKYIVIQRLASAMQAWLGGALPGGAGHPSLAEIEAGYQELRRTLGTGLRTMAWAVPEDVLEAAQHDW
eukprot:5569410-Lingulodinium_polyedra.AAC.1